MSEISQAHGLAVHSQTQYRRTVDRLKRDHLRDLLRHRGGLVDLSPLAAAVRGDAGRGIEAADSAGQGECPDQEPLVEAELGRRWPGTSPNETSQPGMLP